MTTRLLLAAIPLVLALLLLSCSPASNIDRIGKTGPTVRVCIADPASALICGLQAGAIIETDRKQYTLQDSSRLTCLLEGDGQLRVRVGTTEIADAGTVFRCWYRDGTKYFLLDGRRYSDTLLLTTDGKRLYAVNTLPLERYLGGVVANEIGTVRTEDEIEAVKAQAVLARTYALMKIELPLTRLFDVYSDARDQVFTGMEYQTELSVRAVRATAGQALSFEGKLAECYYHGTCGGSTEAVSLVWKRPQSKPYLVGVKDAGRHGSYCAMSPSYRWTETYQRGELEGILRTYLPAASDSMPAANLSAAQWHLLDLRILDRMPSGRVSRLGIIMGNRSRQWKYAIDADRIRWVFRRPDAHSILRSGLFDLEIARDANQWITSVTVRGGGNGHGIGFCQWGAIGRAKKGFLAEEILQAYFPGTAIVEGY